MQFNKKRAAVIVGATTVALAGAGVAFAFWSASGTGDGTATTQAGSSFSVTQTAAPTDLAPGVDAEGIQATVTNNGTSSAKLNQVVVSIQSVTKATGVSGTCDASDYTLSNPTMTNAAAELGPGATSDTFSGATLAFNDKSATNQDACKGATVNLHYAAS